MIGCSVLLALALHPAAPSVAADPKVQFRAGYPVTTRRKMRPLSKIKRGDQGIGYTVLSGSEVTPFSVEVLGILEGMLGPGKDLILAKLGGKEIEFTGVIAGMSGSPVYIDGELIGAVAYRFGAFTKEPIAGITPIASMVDIGKIPKKRQTPGRAAAARPGSSIAKAVEARPFEGREPAPVALPVPPKFSDGLQPIATPLIASGLAPEVFSEFSQAMAKAGFLARRGGGRGPLRPRDSRARKNEPNKKDVAGTVSAAPIAPGAPIAALLMKGDINMMAIGTVTMVEGKQVYGFGHPFLGLGQVMFPMATASIINTLASEAGSYKQGVVAREVGAIEHDRLTAIAGRLGVVAPMVPLKIRVTDLDGKTPAEVTNCEAVDDPVWLPNLVQNALASAALNRLGFEAGGMIEFDVRLHVGDRTMAFSDAYAGIAPMRIAAFAANDVANTISSIVGFDQQAARFRGIEVDMRVSRTTRLAEIESALPRTRTVRAGDKVVVDVSLRRYRNTPQKMKIAVLVPHDAVGNVSVVVGGAVEIDRRDSQAFGGRVPRTLDDLMGILSERRPSRALYGRAYQASPGVNVGAESLTGLPPSRRLAISSAGGGDVRAIKERVGQSSTVPATDIIVGRVEIPIEVLPAELE